MSSERINSSSSHSSIDLHNPFFIHPSDLTGQPLIPFKLEGSSNYRKWRRAVEKAFSSKLKLGFLRGTQQRTEENIDLWNRCNDLSISWLLGVINPDIYDSVFEIDTAWEIWKELEECYALHTGPSKYQVLKDIHSIQQGGMSVSDYYTKMKSLWMNLASMRTSKKCVCHNCTCNLMQNIEKEEEEERLMTFLMGLNDTFTAIRGNLLLMNPLPSIATAYHLISQEEDQRKHNQGDFSVNNSSQYTALLSRQMEGRSGSKTAIKKEGKCTHCEGNHQSEKCWEVFGYPEWHASSKEKPQRPGITYEPRKCGKKKGPRVNVVQTEGSDINSSITPDQQTLVNSILSLISQSQNQTNSAANSATVNLAVSHTGPWEDKDSGDW
ncbi:hypothetical protein Ancab_039981 [Ancistrocladus abbreviatus]